MATYLGRRTFPPQALDLAIPVNLVVLEHSQLGLLALVLDLLGCGVHLLLSLLSATTQTEDEVKSRLLLNIVVAQGSAVFKLLSGENKALLVWRDTLLVYEVQVSAHFVQIRDNEAIAACSMYCVLCVP